MTCGYRTLTAGCKWLAALATGYAFGHERGRGRTSPPTGADTASPSEAGRFMSESWTAGTTREPGTSAGTATASSLPMTKGGGFYAPCAVAGSRASAGAWAEALSATGKQLSDEGFEEQSVMCFVAAGELDAIAHGDTA